MKHHTILLATLLVVLAGHQAAGQQNPIFSFFSNLWSSRLSRTSSLQYLAATTSEPSSTHTVFKTMTDTMTETTTLLAVETTTQIVFAPATPVTFTEYQTLTEILMSSMTEVSMTTLTDYYTEFRTETIHVTQPAETTTMTDLVINLVKLHLTLIP